MTMLPTDPDEHRRDQDTPLRRVARTHEERILALNYWLDGGIFDDGVAYVRSAVGWMMWLEGSLDAAAASGAAGVDSSGATRRSVRRSTPAATAARGGKKAPGTAGNRSGERAGERAGEKAGRTARKKSGRGATAARGPQDGRTSKAGPKGAQKVGRRVGKSRNAPAS
jgi:hypothetical protein